MFQLKAENQGLQLLFELAQNVPQYIQTDEVKLRQVLINLLSNTIKFTQKGSVTVRVRQGLGIGEDNSQSLIAFEVEDTGMVSLPMN